MSAINKMVATAVVAAMQREGVSTLSLSKRTGIPETTLRRSLGYKRSFPIEELDAICEALGMTLKEIFDSTSPACV